MIEIQIKDIKYTFKDHCDTIDMILAQNKMPTGYILIDKEGKPRTPENQEEKDKQIEGGLIMNMLMLVQLSITPKLTLKQLQESPMLYFKIIEKMKGIVEEALFF